jgi:hypothetical protein
MATDSKEHTFTIIDTKGDERNITLTVTNSATWDPAYGADADGNRGVGMWLDDELDYDDLSHCDDGFKLTEHDLLKLNEAINEWAPKQDWDFSDEEREYDDV